MLSFCPFVLGVNLAELGPEATDLWPLDTIGRI